MTKLDATYCYALFGLKLGATQAQIKEAYRKLASQWHPDKYAHNPELETKALEQIKNINAANDFLKIYDFVLVQPSHPKHAAQAGRNDQNAHEAEQRKQEAERRKQEAERRRQKVQQEDTERRRQQSERRQQAEREKLRVEHKRREALLHEAERKKREAIQQREWQKLKAEQPERERQLRQEQWRKSEQERIHAQNVNAAKTAHEPSDSLTRESESKIYHQFHQGKCLRCGRSKQSLAFYPDAPCL